STGDRVNMVYTGSVVTYGRARAVVTSTGMETEFGKIAREVAAVETGRTPLELRTQEIGKWLGIGALLICLVVIGVSALREYMSDTLSVQSMVTMLMFGVALAVAAVPEALAAIVTGALAIGMREMAKQNALVRKMSAVETLGSTTVICTDKTGTLTRGEMTVRRLFISGRYYDVSGAGYEPVGDIAIEGSEVASNDALAHMAPLFKAGVLCNDSDLLSQNDGTWAIKGDPTEAALLVLAEKAGYKLEEIRHKEPRQEEIPFSSERKLMSTVNLSDKGYVAYIKGAPEQVLSRSVNILGPDGSVRPITDDDLSSALHAAEEMATSALRVLALAYRDVSAPDVDEKEAEQGLTFAGLAGMMDPPRPEAIEAIATCRKVHIRPVMITGDHKLTAMAVAREMGIYMEGDMVLTGRELEAMSQEEFDRVVDKVSVYARVSPMDKLKIVTAWKHRGEVVAMTGDGVNDAPALKHADIGIAMGLTGTEVAKEAADMVLADDNFATIVRAVELGRWIFDNIKKYLTFLIQCNITEVLVIGGIVLWFGPHYLPLLPAAILYINLATDGLPALALGVAPPDEDIMLRPPRNPRESVFTSDVVSFLARAVILEFPLFIWIYLDSLPDLELARTRIFFMFIIIELVIALNCRSLRFSVFKAPPHKWLIIAIFWEIVMIVVLMQIPQIRESFGVSIPSLSDLLLIFGLGLLVFIVMEAMKMALRAMGDKGLKK
ncbi:MAG TPA: cation-translocating P-type ATPase, partial [Nitrospirae bacterium]|nr:cation-translocating P-type ATPase [Nitrospirota bacterium]